MKICLSCEGVSNTPASRCGHCGASLLPTDTVHYPARAGEIDAGNPLLGTVVDGKYRLHGVLGRGGLGTVFRAQHIGSLMHVALKLLHPRFADRPEYRTALLPEARRAAAVTDDRCARLLDVGEAADGIAYLAMELVEGKTLDVLVRSGPLAPSHAVVVLEQIAQALAAIHAAGLVHCDLSPRNVMVAGRNHVLRVKVLDFGIARSVSLAGPAPPGEFAGFVNPAFSAPELLAGGDVDPRADLWSFGVLAWLLLTGTMPVDDADARRAAAAVMAGDLRPWPATARAPRRLVRLVRRCLQHDPAARPASAAMLLRELAIVRGARRPLVVRSGLAALGLGVVAVVATGGAKVAPFLQLLQGTPLQLASGPAAGDQRVQDLRSDNLASLVFSYGGFAPSRLRANLVRHGRTLDGATLRPEVDAAAGTLTVSRADPAWRTLLEQLALASRDEALDLAFVVPGAATLGSARLRVDDVAPRLQAELGGADAGLRASTFVHYRAADDVGLAGVAVHVTFRGGRTEVLPMPPAGERFQLGDELAKVARSNGALGEGEVRFVATDRAGNRTERGPLPFRTADVAVPAVLEVGGPLGEPFVPVVSGRAIVRLRLSGAEPGCTLVIGCGSVIGRPIPLAEVDTHTLELDVGPDAANAPWWFEVVDPAQNRSHVEMPVRVRDRSTQVDFTAAQAVRWLDGELVVGEQGAVTASFGSNWQVDAVRLEAAAPSVPAATGDGLHYQVPSPSSVRLEFRGLAPGSHRLRFQLSEGADDGAQRRQVSPTVVLRVLPSAIDVHVPVARSRFLPGLLESGVLAAVAAGGSCVDGPGWRLDPALRPYLRGTLWVGIGNAVGVPLAGPPVADAPLLPPTALVCGRNRLAVELFDVLERPARVHVGDDPPTSGPGRVVVADFWWHNRGPELVGEELQVEHGQPVVVRLRLPLPFIGADREALRLSIAERELVASAVVAQGDDASLVTFDVPFTVWSVAAGLLDVPREQFEAQLERSAKVAVLTPAGQLPLELRLRTTRSTLVPMSLGDLRPLPPALAALAALRFLPVLAPAGPFAEPVPAIAPPRAAFRPQVAVAVKNMGDVLLQDREFTCGEARTLVAALGSVPVARRRLCVHHDDVLGAERMAVGKLLPPGAVEAPDGASLVGVTFFQAYSLSRLLGLVVADDPAMFRLPLGCELELAAFGLDKPTACHGAGSRGGAVAMAPFLGTSRGGDGRWLSAARSVAAGDVVPTAFGEPFLGLDFGVGEWVLDLPSAESVLKEWIADRDLHLARVLAMADGTFDPVPEAVAPLRQIGVVRGLAFGRTIGLLDEHGSPVDAMRLRNVPASVPGVLRSEQLRRDGQDLLAGGIDARLSGIGFRLVAQPDRVAQARGRR